MPAQERTVAQKKMINVRLNPELWNRAKAAAGERGMTLERWVSDALEAHIGAQRGRVAGPVANGAPGAAASDATRAGSAGGAGGAGAAVDVNDLAWRVSALEQAVDYLAGQLGGFGKPPAEAAAGPQSGRGAATRGAA
jgi:hypothetical protein